MHYPTRGSFLSLIVEPEMIHKSTTTTMSEAGIRLFDQIFIPQSVDIDFIFSQPSTGQEVFIYELVSRHGTKS